MQKKVFEASAFALISFSIVLLQGCVINGVEMTPDGITKHLVKGIAEDTYTHLRASSEVKKSEWLIKSFENGVADDEGKISNEFISEIQSIYQGLVDRMVAEIRTIQKEQLPNSILNKKGILKDVEIVVYRDPYKINAWAEDDILTPKIHVPTGLFTQSISRLESEFELINDEDIVNNEELGFFDKQFALAMNDFFGKAEAYQMAIEFEEMIRFVVAHELSHLWLHEPGVAIREREIEADAWGVILSSNISKSIDLKVKSAHGALSGGYSTDNSYDMALLNARSGPEILFLLYGEDGIFDIGAERQNYQERVAHIEENIEEIYETKFNQVNLLDMLFFQFLNI